MTAAPRATAPAGTRAGRIRRVRVDTVVLGVSCVVLGVAVLAAVAPGALAPVDPLAVDPRTGMRPPGPGHVFGTDESGRDVLARVVHGARASLSIGAVATAIGLGLGVALGTLAALGPRAADWIVGRVLEVGFAFPGILLALLVIALWGPGVVTSTIAVGLSTFPGYARVVRATMLTVRRSGYVEAEIVLGRSWWHRLRHTIAPNALAPLFALATLGLGQAIVWASALAFLGLGEPPPAPEWGSMLSAGRTYLLTGAWWLTVAPGTVIVVVALAATAIGRVIQRRTRAAGSAS